MTWLCNAMPCRLQYECHTKKSVCPDILLANEQRWDWRIKGYNCCFHNRPCQLHQRHVPDTAHHAFAIPNNPSDRLAPSASNYKALMYRENVERMCFSGVQPWRGAPVVQGSRAIILYVSDTAVPLMS